MFSANAVTWLMRSTFDSAKETANIEKYRQSLVDTPLVFNERGMTTTDAEGMADALMLRDREADDRRPCGAVLD